MDLNDKIALISFLWSVVATLLSLRIALQVQHWYVRNYRFSGRQKAFETIVQVLRKYRPTETRPTETISVNYLDEAEIYFSLMQMDRVACSSSILEKIGFYVEKSKLDLPTKILIPLLRNVVSDKDRISTYVASLDEKYGDTSDENINQSTNDCNITSSIHSTIDDEESGVILKKEDRSCDTQVKCAPKVSNKSKKRKNNTRRIGH
jgi:hypothetical protein